MRLSLGEGRALEALRGVDCSYGQLEEAVVRAGAGSRVRFLALTEAQWQAVREALGQYEDNEMEAQAEDETIDTHLEGAQQVLEYMQLDDLKRAGG